MCAERTHVTGRMPRTGFDDPIYDLSYFEGVLFYSYFSAPPDDGS